MTNAARWAILLGIIVFFVLVYLLGPILSPFITGAILAYLFDPIVNRLQTWKIPRVLGVIIVFGVISALLALTIMIIVPLIEEQIILLFSKLPAMINWAEKTIAEYAQTNFKLNISEKIQAGMQANAKSTGGFVANLLKTVSSSTFTIIAALTNLLLVPVVLFYLLRDWHAVLSGIEGLLPRSSLAIVKSLFNECDEVLSAFLRGQLLVMIALAILYSAGLSIVGLDLAIIIGCISGLVSIVPYLGFIVGILSASIAVMFQFHDAVYLIYVAIVFLAANGLEGAVLTPLLVGDKIGLHPVAVIFAVLAGGQLFGFIGILLALPVAAIIMVFIRYFTLHYKQSGVYSEVAS